MPSCNDDATLKHIVYAYDRTDVADVVSVLFEFRKSTSAPFAFVLPITGELHGAVTPMVETAVQNLYDATIPTTASYRNHIATRVEDMTKDAATSNTIMPCGYTGDGVGFASHVQEADVPSPYNIATINGLLINCTNKGNVGRFANTKIALNTTLVYQPLIQPLVRTGELGAGPTQEEYLAGTHKNIKYVQVYLPQVKKGVCGFTYSVVQSIDEPSCFQAFCRTFPGNTCSTIVSMIGHVDYVVPYGFTDYIENQRQFVATSETLDTEPMGVKGFVSPDNTAMVIAIPDPQGHGKTVFIFGGTWDDFVRVDI